MTTTPRAGEAPKASKDAHRTATSPTHQSTAPASPGSPRRTMPSAARTLSPMPIAAGATRPMRRPSCAARAGGAGRRGGGGGGGGARGGGGGGGARSREGGAAEGGRDEGERERLVPGQHAREEGEPADH